MPNPRYDNYAAASCGAHLNLTSVHTLEGHFVTNRNTAGRVFLFRVMPNRRCSLNAPPPPSGPLLLRWSPAYRRFMTLALIVALAPASRFSCHCGIGHSHSHGLTAKIVRFSAGGSHGPRAATFSPRTRASSAEFTFKLSAIKSMSGLHSQFE